MTRRSRVIAVVCFAVGVAACHSPSTPSNSVVGSQPTAPSGGSAISYYDQPVTLVVSSSVATGGVSTASTVEVATDAGFANIVATQAPTMNAAGQPTVTLNHLSASTTYYWRVKTTAPGGPSVTSAATSFTMGPPLVIQAPAVVTPVADTYPHKRPTFTVANATHTGPAATLTYHFDVASDAVFANIVATGTVSEAAGQTSFVPGADLTPASTYYWRAQASDATKGVTGPYSSAQVFTTVNPDDGLWRYILTLHLVSAVCPSFGAPAFRDASFDNGLVVSGDHVQFVLPTSDGLTWLLKVDLQRTGSQFSGTVVSNFPYLLPWPGSRGFGATIGPGPVSGTVDNTAGRFIGTYQGHFSEEGFPFNNQCNGEVGVTLTPH